LSLSERSVDPDYRGHRNWAKRGVSQRFRGDSYMNNDRLEFLKEDYVQGFPAAIGFEVDRAEYGIFESRLKIRSDHSQQDGFVHAGVIATMADHTAGYAAYTTVSEAFRILTIEFKINFFKPAVGKHIVCRSKVVNNGNKIKVSESELFSLNEDKEKLVAKAMVTLIAIPSSNLQ
jgi:uncharacterized protein (TIGR00369 family)